MTHPWFDPAAVGRRLRKARGDRSQREVGAALGHLQPHISRYERGDVPASFGYLAGLATLFDVDLNWLLTGRASPGRMENLGEGEAPSATSGRRLARELR